MACTSPLKGYRAQFPNPETGKYSMVFSPRAGYPALPIDVPCGQCMKCRIEKSRQWAIRMHHEGQQHEENCFITLTYDEKHLPADYCLNIKHFQDFMKRLRKHYGPQTKHTTNKTIRFYHCGEYGDDNRRPHYHSILFGHQFEDKKPYRKSKKGYLLYKSEILTKIWGKGLCDIGEFTFDSAGYCAQYITKKITGDTAKEHYAYLHPDTNKIVQQTPEYSSMSRRPGIGKDWYDQYGTQTYNNDYVVIKGRKMKPPKFYDTQIEKEDPDKLKYLKEKRLKTYYDSSESKLDPTDRLHVIDACTQALFDTNRKLQ